MKILVTGAAGFIGMHTSQVLLARGDQVVGIAVVFGWKAVSAFPLFYFLRRWP